MQLPQFISALLPFMERVDHMFLIFDLPEEKYGHHTALVWHRPKQTYRKVVAHFGRFEKEIMNAEFLGEVRMSRPYAGDELEEDAIAADPRAGWDGCGGVKVFEALKKHRERLQGEDVAPVAVYLVKVRTKRGNLLYDGDKSHLPSGYLTFYPGKVA
ncbi:hypothetical protein DFH08DRAFT_897620 [Mycena albidolilacea]|uniref:Uncharacterized protein n=1 Tax=Mycena albidolilacea TaxID=1033008 RepID=A0AAD6Z8E0_9AGAR|nr:hypothetical protein DFH08DRAFT_897620 [Mycena albidolilacea]